MNKDCFLKLLSAFELSHAKISKILLTLGDDFNFDSFIFNSQIENILGDEYSAIAKKFNQQYLDAYLNRLQEKGIGLVTIAD